MNQKNKIKCAEIEKGLKDCGVSDCWISIIMDCIRHYVARSDELLRLNKSYLETISEQEETIMDLNCEKTALQDKIIALQDQQKELESKIRALEKEALTWRPMRLLEEEQSKAVSMYCKTLKELSDEFNQKYDKNAGITEMKRALNSTKKE